MIKFMALAMAAGIAQFPAARAEDFKVEKDLPFLGPDRQERMDAYLPADKFARPLPAVIWIHGGSWWKGDKADGRELNICSTLAANGYAAFSINYQLGKKADKNAPADAGSAPWPQNFQDCKSALRYVRSEATRFGIDPNRIAISGGSAGGHLALLTGMSWNDPEMNKGGLYTGQSNQVSCIIDFYGAVEIVQKQWIKQFAGATPEETEANIKAASPKTYLTPETPPILIVHGTADETVNIQQSREFAAALQTMGIAHQMVEVPEGKHAFHLQPPQMDLRPVVLQFLEKYLGKPGL